jgi:hypothetical protein
MTTSSDRITAFTNDIDYLSDAPADDTNARAIMTAIHDLAQYIAACAARQLRPDYPFSPAFLDDDSDYLPAALALLDDLMIAATNDSAPLACDALIDRIFRDDLMLTIDHHYSDLPLDAPCDLPIRDQSL